MKKLRARKKARPKPKAKPARPRSLIRRIILWTGVTLLVLVGALSVFSVWFIHHPEDWLESRRVAWPRFVTGPLFFLGNPLGEITDALNWTGCDVVYEYDTEAPANAVVFAGLPVRVGAPAPADIVVLDRGDFRIGWSPSLKHPVWCAYHVPAAANHPVGGRPRFSRDAEVPSSPKAGVYSNTGYDRGHMVPNYAIASRFGETAQVCTFRMTNIAPQMPALNRGVWRIVEHRIADLWTARWGELWVIVGAISDPENHEKLSGSDVDVPQRFYQIVVAQEGMDVRVFALLFPQEVPWSAYPTRYLTTVDEIERLTGLDFFSELPQFIQRPLEAELPTRLWPIRFGDILRLIGLWFEK